MNPIVMSLLSKCQLSTIHFDNAIALHTQPNNGSRSPIRDSTRGKHYEFINSVNFNAKNLNNIHIYPS